jgi:hypothetical protein
MRHFIARLKSFILRLPHRYWAFKNVISFDVFAASIDYSLYQETLAWQRSVSDYVIENCDISDFKVGGGGAWPLLYFLTRVSAPKVIVETGVAAGFSSFAFLSAIKSNGLGHLYSSDRAYLRAKGDTSYVGSLVSSDLKCFWTLDLNGDDIALPRFIDSINSKVGIFHYDSDKSYLGRSRALSLILKVSSSQSIFIFDDIQDNSHFKDLVLSSGLPFRVFCFEKKYVGLVVSLNNNLEIK